VALLGLYVTPIDINSTTFYNQNRPFKDVAQKSGNEYKKTFYTMPNFWSLGWDISIIN
jgi:hypothetical protein